MPKLRPCSSNGGQARARKKRLDQVRRENASRTGSLRRVAPKSHSQEKRQVLDFWNPNSSCERVAARAGDIFDSGQAQSDGAGCAIKIKYVFECAYIGAKRVQASPFSRARFWRGDIGCFQPKQNSACALGACGLKMCVKDVHEFA